jgi:hypothetical protein
MYIPTETVIKILLDMAGAVFIGNIASYAVIRMFENLRRRGP